MLSSSYKLLQNFRMTCGNCFVWIDSNWSTPTIYSSDFSQSTIKCCFEFLTTRKTLSLKQGLSTVACEVSSLFCLPWKHFLKSHISSVPIACTSASKYGVQNSYTIPLSQFSINCVFQVLDLCCELIYVAPPSTLVAFSIIYLSCLETMIHPAIAKLPKLADWSGYWEETSTSYLSVDFHWVPTSCFSFSSGHCIYFWKECSFVLAQAQCLTYCTMLFTFTT